MFELWLFQNRSPRNFMHKSIGNKTIIGGTLRDECDIINPSITIEMATTPVDWNYIYIPLFERYYYINNITSVRTNLWRFDCEVDVLMSFKDDIDECKGIVERAESAGCYNVNLDDGAFRCYSNPQITTKKFSGGFSGHSYILAVAGSSQNV